MAKIAIAPRVATTADTWTPSRRMQAAALAERERVDRELVRLAAREGELAAELAAVQEARADLEHQLNVLNHFAHDGSPQQKPSQRNRRLRAVPNAHQPAADGVIALRGARIRETAVRVLAANNQPEAPVHYRDWFELLTAQGFMPAGKDPLATFLTQVGRSPVVQRTTTSGMYVLDLEFAKRAEERLEQLRAQLAEMHEPAADITVEEIAAARSRRTQLTAALQETERDLQEALRSLGTPAF